MTPQPRCLVTGATGYLGGRLVPALLAAGYRVRCLVRDPAKLDGVPWADQVERVAGDVLDPQSTAAACEGVEVLYYLVHSLTERGFAGVDRRAALVTAEAARAAGVGRIVYQGGLHPDEDDQADLSDHLGSRAEVGEIFLRSGVPTVVLQAAVIIGSGSASFEMLRHLTERLPLMVTPAWVRSRVQPIAVGDVLHYLVAAAGLPPGVNRTFDVGGPDVLTYREMMQRYAAVAGLPRRRMLPVGVLTPALSSHWINVVTPVPRAIGAPLIGSLVHDAVCGEHDLADLVGPPRGGATGFDDAARLALASAARGEVEPRWDNDTGAVPDRSNSDRRPSEPLPSDPIWSGATTYFDVRERGTSASAASLWRAMERVATAAAHGRPPGRWREQSRIDGRVRRLQSQSSLGSAWLELRGSETLKGSFYYQQVAFMPRGLLGHLCWWVMTPVRRIVFDQLARDVVDEAETPEPPGAGILPPA